MKFVVLTKSAKRMHNGGYGNCVAGINENGKWIRLVSDETGDSLSDGACRTFDCLDIIDVEVTRCPLQYQPENVKLERLNGKVGRITIENVIARYGVDGERFCFVNNSNALNEKDRALAKNSLMLIKVQKLKVYQDDNEKIKVQFTYNNILYENISITDNRNKKPAEYRTAYIVVSLPSETGGYAGYYKFVAAIYPI